MQKLFNSGGANFGDFETNKKKRYKLFADERYRNFVIGACRRDLNCYGISEKTSVQLALVVSHVTKKNGEKFLKHFNDRGLRFHGPDWLRDGLKGICGKSYENDASILVAKLLIGAIRETTEQWLCEEVTPAYDAMKSDPKRGIPANEVFAKVPARRVLAENET